MNLPPRWADRFLERFCNEDLLEDLQGDLYQRFNERTNRRGAFFAKIHFIIDVVSFIKPYIFRRTFRKPKLFPMLKNNIVFSLRYMYKNKIFSFINIIGLSLSLACTMLIILYGGDEFSFDRFHQDVNSIYRIAIEVRNPDGSTLDKFGGAGVLHGPRFKANIPEIEAFTRITRRYRNIRLKENIESQVVLVADSNMFSMFNFPLLQGDPKTALKEPRNVVISESIAVRQFGSKDALNKAILIENNGVFEAYVVTGVARSVPENSSIQFDMILPLIISAEEEASPMNWVNLSGMTFMRLRKGSDYREVEKKMQKVFQLESKGAMQTAKDMGFNLSFFHALQPMTDIHLSQTYKAEGDLVNPSNPLYSYILSTIAIFLLVIACTNFINLTVAKSAKRAKEIGVRKVVGSSRRQLIRQFLQESFLLCSLSFITALLLAQLLLPIFNNLANKQLSLLYLADARLIVAYLILLPLTALLAGLYPAFVLSRYNPIQVISNQIQLQGGAFFQKSLTVFQFVVAMIMIIATLTIYSQFDYLSTKDVGFDMKGLIRVKKPRLTTSQANLFQAELSKSPTIVSSAPLGHNTMNVKLKGDSIFNAVYETTDENFIDLMKISVIQGRNFSKEFPSDSADAMLVNEAFAKMVGWTDPIGQVVNLMPFEGHRRKIVGVVKNYHFESLKYNIKPEIFIPTSDEQFGSYDQLLIRIQPGSENSALTHIEQTFKKLFPALPFSYDFYDRLNHQNYELEAKWTKMILWAAFLTIFIACLGLFGLSMLMAEKRFKEIGIRKILGASAIRIMVSLAAGPAFLILIAMVIALPLAFYLATRWLQSYPYRISVSAGMLVWSFILAVAIALIAIAHQTIKASLMNPVDALRRD